jgi:hypothetical protein
MSTIIDYPYLGNSSLRKQVKMSISSSAHRSGRRIIICSSIRHLRCSKATTSLGTRTKLPLVYERAENIWEQTIICENVIVWIYLEQEYSIAGHEWCCRLMRYHHQTPAWNSLAQYAALFCKYVKDKIEIMIFISLSYSSGIVFSIAEFAIGVVVLLITKSIEYVCCQLPVNYDSSH